MWTVSNLKQVFTSKTLILTQKSPEFGFFSSELAPNEKICKLNVLFCPSDNFHSNDIWFSWIFTYSKWVFTSKTLDKKGSEIRTFPL